MNYKVVVFDLDGTLVNSIDGIAYSMNLVLEKHDLPVHSTEQYKEFVGKGMKELVRKSIPIALTTNANLTNECLKDLKDFYSRYWGYKMSVYDGIHELLETLTFKGISLAINTNKELLFTEMIISKFFSQWKFGCIIGNSSVQSIKPDPEGALFITRTLGVLPEECIYVGDSEVDIQTAKNAGMLQVSALWGFRSKAELLDAGAQNTVSQPQQLLRFVN